MNHALIVSEFLSTPWAVMPDRLTAIAGVIARWSANIPASPEVMAQSLQAAIYGSASVRTACHPVVDKALCAET